jgi:hypothetical protein
VLSDLTAIILEALHQFGGPRVRANAFHIRVSCWGLSRFIAMLLRQRLARV